MKCKKKVLFIFAVVCFLLTCSIPGFCDEKPTCAVLLFYPDVASTQSSESQNLSSQYANLLSRLGLFEVIDHNAVSRILAEKNALDLNQACPDKECALRIGQLLNVDYAVYGVIGHIGNLSSIETALINIAGGNEAQRAVTDFEGTEQEFAASAPTENIKSLFGVSAIPEAKETMSSGTAKISGEDASTGNSSKTFKDQTPENTQPIKTEKKLYIVPRIGMGATNDGIELGGGMEAQYKHWSCQFLLNTNGYAAALSYYLKPHTSSPFLALAGSYYDTENHGVDEIGRIYGLLLGYRLNITDQLNARLGLGAGYVNWDQTELNKVGTEFNDEEYIPIFEVSLGYSFGLMDTTPVVAPVPATPPKTDSDKDGVFDSEDACPDTPVGIFVDAKGCPTDSDNDGVTDNNDKCPNTPAGAKVDARGCWVIPGVLFNTDQSTISDENAKKLLSTVIIVMNNFPDRQYEIQGYTDNVGSAAYNQGLSEKRAISVKNYLITKGISGDRLTTKGFGLNNPVASNETEEGRASNRRVEIKPIF